MITTEKNGDMFEIKMRAEGGMGVELQPLKKIQKLFSKVHYMLSVAFMVHDGKFYSAILRGKNIL